jgi:hypothetical protein
MHLPLDGIYCCNLSLGFMTKVGACKGAGQEGSPRVTSHALGSVGFKPKGAPTLGVGVPVDSRIFREQLHGSKPNELKSSLYHWKAFGT